MLSDILQGNDWQIRTRRGVVVVRLVTFLAMERNGLRRRVLLFGTSLILGLLLKGSDCASSGSPKKKSRSPQCSEGGRLGGGSSVVVGSDCGERTTRSTAGVLQKGARDEHGQSRSCSRMEVMLNESCEIVSVCQISK